MVERGKNLEELTAWADDCDDNRVAHVLDDVRRTGGRIEFKPRTGRKTVVVSFGRELAEPQITIEG